MNRARLPVEARPDREGIVVRCFNTTDQPITGTLRLAGGFGMADRVDLDEERQAEQAVAADGTVEITAGPWQIVTVELVP